MTRAIHRAEGRSLGRTHRVDDLILGAEHSSYRSRCDCPPDAAPEVPDRVHPREQTTQVAHPWDARYTRRAMGGLATQLLVGAVGGLVAAAFASVLTYRGIVRSLDHARESDRLADARRLRDDRRGRLRASIETVLHASLTVGQVVADARRIWQTETVEARDARHTKMLEEVWVGLNEARISLMTQTATKEYIRLVDDDVLTVFERYKSAYGFDKQFPDTDAHKDLALESKLLEAGIERLRAEAVRLLDELEKPIPDAPVPSQATRTLRGDARELFRRATQYLTVD